MAAGRGPAAAAPLELDVAYEVLLPTVDEMVEPPLVMVVMTGTVVTADEDADVEPEVDVALVVVMVVELVLYTVEDPTVEVTVLPSLIDVRSSGMVVRGVDVAEVMVRVVDAEPVAATSEEKTLKAERVEPETEADAAAAARRRGSADWRDRTNLKVWYVVGVGGRTHLPGSTSDRNC